MAKHEISDARVVVTGGAGFIGSHLVRALLERGAREVVVIDSLRYGDPANLGATSERVKLVKHTLGQDDTSVLEPALANADLLFHLAAEKHNQSKDSPARVYRANIEGTHELYAAACAAGVRKIVFSSSLYAYGRTHGAPFVETELPAPRTVYGVTKLAGEHILAHFGQERGIEHVSLRYLFIYGPRQFAGMGYKSVVMKSFERLLAGQAPIVFGDGEQTLDYVFVDDCVEATLAAMEHDVSDVVCNVASGRAVSVRHLIETMVAVSGRAVEPERGPADWTAGTWRVGSPERAERVLGWTARTSLEQGLRRTFDWLRDAP
ncbi:MAG: NAD-dependent epimerase/dehydratase family protein [Polyangiaceae bacterium]|nr:NAD-dependent epimerase/dehydratase family protein [Polyangiaceae bacterium]